MGYFEDEEEKLGLTNPKKRVRRDKLDIEMNNFKESIMPKKGRQRINEALCLRDDEVDDYELIKPLGNQRSPNKFYQAAIRHGLI